MPETPFPIRNLYCPSHFGNVFEVAFPEAMGELLSEARGWGYNYFSDWFDTIEVDDLYASSDPSFSRARAVWERKFHNYAQAAAQGFKLGLTITPNHVFRNQVTTGNAAKHNPRIFGQLLCPSKPGTLEIILGNYRNLFEDFKRRGLDLAMLSFGAYDYGGCACDACAPWIVAFGKLSKAIAEVGREVFGRQEIQLWCWWWDQQEHADFAAWADREAPGLFTFAAQHIKYGQTEYGTCQLPRGCANGGFVHVGYGDAFGADRIGSYGHFGQAIAPDRLKRTLDYHRQRQAGGFLAYCESDADEINRALLGGLASGRFTSAEAILRCYAERHFPGNSDDWCQLMLHFRNYESLDHQAARRLLEKLAGKRTENRRIEAFRETLNMRQHDLAVRAASTWDTDRLAHAREYLAAKERLWGRCYRMGLGMHIFKFDWIMPEWYRSYCDAIRPAHAAASGTPVKEA